MSTTLDPELVAVLACAAEDHGPLTEVGDELHCTDCGRRYPVVDGIPVLLIDHARRGERA